LSFLKVVDFLVLVEKRLVADPLQVEGLDSGLNVVLGLERGEVHGHGQLVNRHDALAGEKRFFDVRYTED